MRAALDTYGVPYTYFADSEAARGQPAREVRRDHLPARRRHRAVAGQRHRRRRATTPLPYKKTDETPNLGVARSDRRHPRRHGHGRADGAGEVRAARAARSSPKARRRRSSRSTASRPASRVESADGPVRARIDPARRGGGPHEPDRLRLRRADAAGLLQPGAGAERGRRWLGGFGGGRRRRWPRCRASARTRTPMATLSCDIASASTWTAGSGRGRRAVRRPAAAGGVPAAVARPVAASTCDESRPRVVLVVPAQPRRHAAVGHARRRSGPRRTARRCVDAPLGRATS